MGRNMKANGKRIRLTVLEIFSVLMDRFTVVDGSITNRVAKVFSSGVRTKAIQANGVGAINMVLAN